LFHDASTLTLAALGTWIVTALLGVNLLLRGKAYRLFLYAAAGRAPTGKRPPVARAILMGLHLVCAVAGLVAWTAYAIFDRKIFAYVALSLLGVIALLGICVVDRWRNGFGRHARPAEVGRNFPVWSATVHVMIATTTIVLVTLITLLNIGE
jgi:hypothetical protein